jgi:hypothetical protein
MENRELKLDRYPSAEELYALERAARAARAQAMAKQLHAGVAAVKRFFARDNTKGLRHA